MSSDNASDRYRFNTGSAHRIQVRGESVRIVTNITTGQPGTPVSGLTLTDERTRTQWQVENLSGSM